MPLRSDFGQSAFYTCTYQATTPTRGCPYTSLVESVVVDMTCKGHGTGLITMRQMKSDNLYRY